MEGSLSLTPTSLRSCLFPENTSTFVSSKGENSHWHTHASMTSKPSHLSLLAAGEESSSCLSRNKLSVFLLKKESNVCFWRLPCRHTTGWSWKWHFEVQRNVTWTLLFSSIFSSFPLRSLPVCFFYFVAANYRYRMKKKKKNKQTMKRTKYNLFLRICSRNPMRIDCRNGRRREHEENEQQVHTEIICKEPIRKEVYMHATRRETKHTRTHTGLLLE